ncbi:MAG: hypothetical protein GW946_00745 [Candidatus Pacebacteria bacterium]|nr:hypothetical protein [Candidatus Paceibacterota bacterium]PIR60858.1 MAG: hypothetical protein COU67_00170 [Candidatus Pacebacteria bacterium CG10_big_fil_rev_8_21_14_0_10_44_54]
MLKKTVVTFVLVLLLLQQNTSAVLAQSEDNPLSCGKGFWTPGIDIVAIEGLSGTIINSQESHTISIDFYSEVNFPEYYLRIDTPGNSSIYTDRISAESNGSDKYKTTFVINDLLALAAFSTTEARTYTVTFFANRNNRFDEMCEVGNYVVKPQEIQVDLNNPDRYCGIYDDSTFECVAMDGTKYPSENHNLCSNSQYGCCSKAYLSLTNNVCPSEQIRGCGTLVGSDCRTSDNKYIKNYSSCTSRPNVCCFKDDLSSCPAPGEPAPEPVVGCGTWVGGTCKTADGKFVRDPRGCVTDTTQCCSNGSMPTSCTEQTPTPQPTPVINCGQLVGTSITEMCKIGDELLGPRNYYACPTNRECCRQSTQCTPLNEDPATSPNPNENNNPADDVVDPPFQGPTVATFNALNPLIIGNSEYAVHLSTPGGIVSRFLIFAFPIAGLILFGMLVWAGFEILAGASNQKSLDAGKQRATAAIVGFLLLFASYWLMQIVEVIFGISIL